LYEKYREDMEEYAQRTTDLTVVSTGKNFGVPTYIIMSSLIYGFGTGPFNNVSIQIPKLIRAAIENGQPLHVGDGLATWNHVHIADLAALYVIILGKVISGANIPSGKKGIYFSGSGRHTWLGLAQSIGDAGLQLGVLKSAKPKSITLEEAGQILTGGNLQRAQLGFASRSVTNADMAAELGWKPQKTDADWEAWTLEEFKYILDTEKIAA
jgi:nucleoside-diphosphate-sugar epimerase